MSDRVLVTGGTGFVAGWAIVALLEKGYRVRATVRGLGREGEVRRAVAGQVDPGDRLEMVAADLLDDRGWAQAMVGCRFALHIASPMGGLSGDALIETAVAGTRRVLSFAAAAGVEHLVMTSSTAACTPPRPLVRPIDEQDWTDPEQPGLAAYRRSKALAERAAWAQAAQGGMKLTTLLPGAIFGPVLRPDQGGSVDLVRGLLHGRPKLLPRLAFNITDVRDLAALHVTALETPAAAGERFIVMGDALWFRDIALLLRHELGERARQVPMRALPDWAARLLARVSPQMRELLPLLGRTQAFSRDKAVRLLGFAPRPPGETVRDCATSLLA